MDLSGGGSSDGSGVQAAKAGLSHRLAAEEVEREGA